MSGSSEPVKIERHGCYRRLVLEISVVATIFVGGIGVGYWYSFRSEFAKAHEASRIEWLQSDKLYDVSGLEGGAAAAVDQVNRKLFPERVWGDYIWAEGDTAVCVRGGYKLHKSVREYLDELLDSNSAAATY